MSIRWIMRGEALELARDVVRLVLCELVGQGGVYVNTRRLDRPPAAPLTSQIITAMGLKMGRRPTSSH